METQSLWSLYTLLAALFILAAVFYVYERRGVSAREAALIATLSALAGLSRVPFAGLPAIQPTTFMVIVAGRVFGPGAGFMVGALASLVSNMFLGHGPWTPWQMLAWGVAGLTGGLFKYLFSRDNRWALVILALLWGFLFGWFMNVWHWVTFVHPLTLSSFFTVQATSLWFDAVHGLSSAAFMLLAGGELIKILDRFRRRLSYTRVESEIENDSSS